MYGHAFVSQYGESPDQVWSWAVGKLDDEAIKRGIVACVDAGGDFPPSLPKFLEYCNPKPAGVRFLGTPVSPKQLLESPKPDREAIDRHLENMRRMVKSAQTARDPSGRGTLAEPKPPISGCTCKSMGTCSVCHAYAKAANGEAAEFPREN